MDKLTHRWCRQAHTQVISYSYTLQGKVAVVADRYQLANNKGKNGNVKYSKGFSAIITAINKSMSDNESTARLST